MDAVAMQARAAAPTSSSPPRSATVLTTAGPRKGGRWQQAFVPVKNEPGVLMRIEKWRLHVDPAYQRRVWTNRVARMAANWSWVSCGTLLVAQRGKDAKTGTYFIIDGQHRWEAAKALDHVKELPCLCFQLDDIKDEAIGFLAANTERKYPSLAEQFKALLIAEDPVAIIANRLAAAAERHISAPSSPSTISCVSELMRLIQMDEKAVDKAWPALARLCHGRAMTSRLIRGVVGLERRLGRGVSLSQQRWVDRLGHVGYDAVVASIKGVVLLDNNSSERACAEGVFRAINRGLRVQLVADLARR